MLNMTRKIKRKRFVCLFLDLNRGFAAYLIDYGNWKIIIQEHDDEIY